MRARQGFLTHCPMPRCRQPAGGILCPEHWRVLSGPTRRALHDELKRLRGQRQLKESPALKAAFSRAFGEVLASATR